ncbi:uncharacterized protein FIBRA_06119 [Fibroporia radiculosa]|uniref:Uncharacterized protein n=1 Tax=Fibroporia radiculosa TaxID=599839 RepID=J4GAP4_9APHY|nr:uncharacterized protein FIBRA_06119 [Fibroporia radiculosa]CCM03963.1 predicted protein [Fibroporia radiculosa]
MSYRQYSPGYDRPRNPDTRQLPPGWTAEYDDNYNAWFYVNTFEEPPRSSWVHPLDIAPRSPRPGGYAPPSGPPPPNDRRGYDSSRGYDQPSWNQGPPGRSYDDGPSPRPYNDRLSPRPYDGGPPSRSYDDGYGSSYGAPLPPGGYRPGGGYGGPPPEESRGWFGGGPSMQQPANVEVVETPPPKKHHMGMGTALAAGGAGILGGMLIGDLIEHHDERERMEGFDQGFQDGSMDQGFMDDNGPGFGW